MENHDLMAQNLWEKFLMLTQEMFRFIEKNEIDMFLSLLDQRIELQKKIEALADDAYHRTTEGREMIKQIAKLNVEIQYKARLWINTTNKNQNMARAYDSLGYGSTGYQFNREF